MSGAAPAALIGGFLAALRVRGETVDVVIAAARTHARARRARHDAAPAADRQLRHRRRRLEHVQHLDRGGAGRRGRGCGGREARQPRRVGALRRRRRARASRRAHRARRGRHRALSRRGRDGVPVRAAPAPGDAARRAGAARARHPHRLQPARTAHQPGLRATSGDRRAVAAALHLVAGALAGLGCDHALVVHSRDGLDEISLGAATDALEVRGSDVVERVLEASDFGLAPVSSDTLKAASVEESASMVRAILDGGAGPRTRRRRRQRRGGALRRGPGGLAEATARSAHVPRSRAAPQPRSSPAWSRSPRAWT